MWYGLILYTIYVVWFVNPSFFRVKDKYRTPAAIRCHQLNSY